MWRGTIFMEEWANNFAFDRLVRGGREGGRGGGRTEGGREGGREGPSAGRVGQGRCAQPAWWNPDADQPPLFLAPCPRDVYLLCSVLLAPPVSAALQAKWDPEAWQKMWEAKEKVPELVIDDKTWAPVPAP